MDKSSFQLIFSHCGGLLKTLCIFSPVEMFRLEINSLPNFKVVQSMFCPQLTGFDYFLADDRNTRVCWLDISIIVSE